MLWKFLPVVGQCDTKKRTGEDEVEIQELEVIWSIFLTTKYGLSTKFHIDRVMVWTPYLVIIRASRVKTSIQLFIQVQKRTFLRQCYSAFTSFESIHRFHCHSDVSGSQASGCSSSWTCAVVSSRYSGGSVSSSDSDHIDPSANPPPSLLLLLSSPLLTLRIGGAPTERRRALDSQRTGR